MNEDRSGAPARDGAVRRDREHGRSARELTGSRALQRLSTRLIPEQPPESLYDQILETAVEMMQADAASLQLLDDDGTRLRLVATRNLHPASTEYWTWVDASHASACGRALSKNERVVVEDVEESVELVGTGDLEAFRASGTRAVQSTPLLTRRGRPIGMISTHWRAPRHIDDSDFGLFDILARQGADLFERSKAEAALRQSESQHAFLLKLSDALRSVADPGMIAAEATRVLVQHLGVDRAEYYETDAAGKVAERRLGHAEHAEPLRGPFTFADFGAEIERLYKAGKPFVVGDVAALPDAERYRAAYAANGIVSAAGMPIIKDGHLRAVLAVTHGQPREWSRGDLAVMEETAERTWAAIERGRAEEALAASEAKYRTIFDSIDEGFAVIEVILDDEGKPVDLLHLETNPAYERHAGVRDVVGKRALEIAPDFDPMWFEFYGQVARTGEAARIESYLAAPVDRWIAIHASRVGGEGSGKVAVVFNDISERKRAEATLRESEERQAFLLKLSDALRPLADPAQIESRASQMLVEHLSADRAIYIEVEGDGPDQIAAVRGQFAKGVPPFPERFSYAEYARGFPKEVLDAHETIVVSDTNRDPRLTAAIREVWLRSDVVAVIATSLIKDGRMVAAFGLHSVVPRTWTQAEIALVEDVADRTWAAVERSRAEAALRANEERQAFLLELGDAMRIESSADGKIAVAARLLGEKLGASRVLYAEYDHEKGLAHIFSGWLADGAQPFPALVKLEDFEGEVLNDLREGRVVRVDDVGRLREESGYAAIASVGVQALLSPPLLVDGKLKFNVSIHQHEPRHWTDDEVRLVKEVSERLWAEIVRARAEEALRNSEERFRQFGEASTDVLWMRDAENLQWTFLSAAFESIYGMPRDQALQGDTMRSWAELIVPEDRERALACIGEVREGRRAAFEYRIRRPADGQIRWLRNTDFPILDDAGKVVRIGGVGTDITTLKDAEKHQRVLLAELQHRVRNTLAVVRSIARRTADNSRSVEQMIAHFQGRLDVFSRVQAAVTRSADGLVDLASLIDDEMVAHAAREGERLNVSGPDVLLDSRIAERLSLAIHELTTNAVKHGALTSENGRISIHWSLDPGENGEILDLHWDESGVALDGGAPEREGFGMELLLRSLPYDLQAETALEFGRDGLRYALRLPLSRSGGK